MVAPFETSPGRSADIRGADSSTACEAKSRTPAAANRRRKTLPSASEGRVANKPGTIRNGPELTGFAPRRGSLGGRNYCDITSRLVSRLRGGPSRVAPIVPRPDSVSEQLSGCGVIAALPRSASQDPVQRGEGVWNPEVSSRRAGPCVHRSPSHSSVPDWSRIGVGHCAQHRFLVLRWLYWVVHGGKYYAEYSPSASQIHIRV